MIILCFIGLSVNLIVFRKYRINYIYIFDINPESRLTQVEILKVLHHLNLDCICYAKYMVFTFEFLVC